MRQGLKNTLAALAISVPFVAVGAGIKVATGIPALPNLSPGAERTLKVERAMNILEPNIPFTFYFL